LEELFERRITHRSVLSTAIAPRRVAGLMSHSTARHPEIASPIVKLENACMLAHLSIDLKVANSCKQQDSPAAKHSVSA
jgi:hypothetical protein